MATTTFAAASTFAATKLISSCSSPKLIHSLSFLSSHTKLPSSSSSSPTLRHHTRSVPKFSTKISATLSVGDKLPESTLSYLDSVDELQTLSTSDLTSNKKAILLAVPGAFTPTCSRKHLPGYVDKAAEFKSNGVDTIACISVNDAFVMKA